MTRIARLKSLFLSQSLAAWLVFAAPRLLRADSTVRYKYEDYREAGGRMAIKTQTALLQQSFGPDTAVKVTGVIDAIAGATPNGQPAPAGSDQVVLTQMHDRRKAWTADASHQFSGFSLDLGIANSRESDYTSTGWSVNTATDFNQKNTELLAGVAGTDDDVKVAFQPNWAKKHTQSLIVGVTQLLDPRSSLDLELSWGHADGFLSAGHLPTLHLRREPARHPHHLDGPRRHQPRLHRLARRAGGRLPLLSRHLRHRCPHPGVDLAPASRRPLPAASRAPVL